MSGGKPLDPDAVSEYLERKFGDDLKATRAVLTRLAKSYPPAELGRVAYSLYERFRPEVPEGKKGWGAKGRLDLDRVERMASRTVKR